MAKSKFLTDLDARLLDDDKIWMLASPLKYYSEMLDYIIEVPAGFQTDFASVPRLPIIFSLWGDRAHRESVIHDFLYRCDSSPVVPCSTANEVFYEAMEATNKSWYVRYPMKWGVDMGGRFSYHKRNVSDKL